MKKENAISLYLKMQEWLREREKWNRQREMEKTIEEARQWKADEVMAREFSPLEMSILRDYWDKVERGELEREEFIKIVKSLI